MKLRLTLAALLLAGNCPLHAGHGLMNAFSDIAWLPDPGHTPDHWLYPLERAGDAAALAFAAPGTETLELALTLCRERLAEAVAMARRGLATEALAAADGWSQAVARAEEAVDRAEPDKPAALDTRLLDDLFEQVYIVTVEYLDLPLRVREQALRPLVGSALAAIERRKQRRDAAAREALFFKEEELRWGVAMMDRGDEQGISNAP